MDGKSITLGTTSYSLPGGGSISPTLSNETVHWPYGSFVTVDFSGDHYLNLTISAAPDLKGHLSGLFGNDDGNPANDLTTGTGVTLPYPATTAELYGTFSNSWRITQAKSLFDYGPGQSTTTFTDLAFPSKATSIATLPPTLAAAAESICQSAGITSEPFLDDCILDLALAGDLSTVTSALAAQNTSMPAAIALTPTSAGPNIVGTSQSLTASLA